MNWTEYNMSEIVHTRQTTHILYIEVEWNGFKGQTSNKDTNEPEYE